MHDLLAAARGQRRRHRLDARGDRARAADDARARALLRGARAREEHAQHVHDVRRRARGRDDHVGARRLLARVRRRQRHHRRARTTRSCTTSAFAPRAGTTIPQLLFMAFQATFCIVTTALVSGAVVERMRFGAVPRLRRAVVGARLRGARALGLRRRLAAGAAARSTSPAACRSRWAPASRRSRRRSSSARARTTGARRCCRTTPSTCCSAPACCGSAGSASTAAAASRPGTPSVLAFTNTLLAPACTLVVWFVLDLLRGRQVTAIGAATAIIVGCVGITPAGRLHQPDAGRWRSARSPRCRATR